ncbi:MAG: DUF3179 domain-containing protein [Acidobacteria bacterium]|nr:DUF3179 domain-containing protein [Acidobacteriota bacterium]
MRTSVSWFSFVLTLLIPAGCATSEEVPEGVEQILPRGRISAVMNPQFVPASRADIPDDAWVLGVVIDGEARAYSLNLLNHHEVVNDRIGDTPFAAVW